MEKRAMKNDEFDRVAYDAQGNPRADGPRCATCGDLAAWGTHQGCERERGKLMVWVTDNDDDD